MAQALTRNRRSPDFDENRKSKLGRPDKDDSRDAKPGCGRTRSSVEAAVMAVERRGSVIYTSKIEQPEMGGLDERREIV
jgi:hypothetical protein